MNPKEDKSVITPPKIKGEKPVCKAQTKKKKLKKAQKNMPVENLEDAAAIRRGEKEGKARAKATISHIKKKTKPKKDLDSTAPTTARGSISKSVKDIFKGKDLKKPLKNKIKKTSTPAEAAKVAEKGVNKASKQAKKVAKEVTK